MDSDKNTFYAFLHSLHDIMRNGDSKYTGMDALNEITNLLTLRLIQDRIGEYNVENDSFEPCEMYENEDDVTIKKYDINEECHFEWLYQHYCTPEHIKHDDGLRENNIHYGNELANLICGEKREYDYEEDGAGNTILRLNGKKASVYDRLFKNNEIHDVVMSGGFRVTRFSPKHREDIRKMIIKIRDQFKDVNFESFDYDAFGEAYEKFKADDVGNSGKRTGQYFTNRQVINYIIMENIKPEHNEKIYDPACGTGGFLHSVDKYVRNKYIEGKITKKSYEKFKKTCLYGNEVLPEVYKPLTFNMMIHNINLDNVKLSDTIKEAVNAKYNVYDVILSNPPYGMSIDTTKTKDKYYFIKVKNSSALFLQHIYNILKVGGRAGVVVDQGIINNGSSKKNSWEKKLRKHLLENCNLHKITMLPTGIFSHTNFATCILFFTKGEETKEVEFVKTYFKDEDKGKGDKKLHIGDSTLVDIEKIIEKDYSLKFSDYLDVNEEKKGDIWVKLGDICEFKRGQILTQNKIIKGSYPVIGGGRKESSYHNEYNREENTIIISQSGSYAGYVNKYNTKIWASDCFSVQGKVDNIHNEYIYYNLKMRQNEMYMLQHGQGQPHVNCEDMKKILFPLLPIEHQEEIVKFLDDVLKDIVIDKMIKELKDTDIFNLLIHREYEIFKEIVWYGSIRIPQLKLELKTIEREKKNYIKSLFKTIKCEEKKLGDLVEITKTGKTIPKEERIFDGDDRIPYYGTGGITGYTDSYIFDGEYILFSQDGSSGKIFIVNGKFWCNHHVRCFKFNQNMKYMFHILSSIDYNEITKKNSIPNITWDSLKNIEISIPLLEDQELIVKKIQEVEDEQHHFQQHYRIIENALNYALETITNLTSGKSSDEAQHDIDDCDSEICDGEQNEEECIGDDIDDNNEINNCDSEICDDEQNEEECIGDDIDEDISQFSENEEEQSQLITKNKSKVFKGEIDNESSDKIVKKNKSKVFKGEIDNESSDKIVKKNKSKVFKGEIDNESSDKIVKKKMKKKTYNDTDEETYQNEEFLPTKKIKNGKLSNKIKKIKVIKKNHQMEKRK
jgi:type I restriction-modification system DNA methylase subunit